MDVNEKIKSLVDSLQELGDALSKNITNVTQSDGQLNVPGNAFDKTEEQKEKDNREKLAKAVGEEINKKQLDFYEKMFGNTNNKSKPNNPWTTASTNNTTTATAQVKPKLGNEGSKDADNLREIKEKITKVEIATINKTARTNLADAIVDGLEDSSIWDRIGKMAGNFGKDMDWGRLLPLLGALGATGLWDWLGKNGAEAASDELDEWGSSIIATIKTILPTGTIKSLWETLKWSTKKTGDVTRAAINTARTAAAARAEAKLAQEAAEKALREATETAARNADEVAKLAKEMSEESIKLVSSVSSYGDDAVKLVSNTIATAGADAGKLVADAIKTSGTDAGKIVATAITNNGTEAGKVVSKVLSDSGVEAAESIAKSIRAGGDEAAKAIATVMGDEGAKIVTTISQQTRNLQSAATSAASTIDDAAKAANNTITITNQKLADAVDKLKKQNIPTPPKPPPAATLPPPDPPPVTDGATPTTAQQKKMDAALKQVQKNLTTTTETTADVAKNVDELGKGAAASAKVEQQVVETALKNTDEAAKAAAASSNAMKLSSKLLLGVSSGISYASAGVRFSDTNILTGEKKDRDYIGGALDVVSGSVAWIPVFGQAISLGIDAGHIALDVSNKGSRMKKYINRLGADSEEMKQFAKAVELRVKEQSKELREAKVGIKNVSDVVKSAQIGAKQAGGWTYHDRTEDFRDELLDAIKTHGKDVDKIYNELTTEAKQNMKLLEEQMGTDYKGVIGGLLQNYEMIKYETGGSVGGGWSYTPSETRYRKNTREGEKLYEAANSLGMQISGLKLSNRKKELAAKEMEQQFLKQEAIQIGNQTIALNSEMKTKATVHAGGGMGAMATYDTYYTGDLEEGQVFTKETMAELERLRDSKLESDQWTWQTLKNLGIEKAMADNKKNKQRLVQEMLIEKLNQFDAEQKVIDEMRQGTSDLKRFDSDGNQVGITTYRFSEEQKLRLDNVLESFKDDRGMTDLPDTYDHLLENMKNTKDPYLRASQTKNLETLMQISGLDAGLEDDAEARAQAIHHLNEEIFMRATEKGKMLKTPKWDMSKVEADKARPSFPHPESTMMLKAQEQQQYFEDMRKLREELKINFESQIELNNKMGQLIDKQNVDPKSNTVIDASSKSSTTVISSQSPNQQEQRNNIHRRLFVNGGNQ